MILLIRRTIPALLLACALFTGCETTDWSYRKTQDGSTVLGRSEAEKALSITRAGEEMKFQVPADAKVYSAIDEPMDWYYSVDLEAAKLSFGVGVEPYETALPVPIQHARRLAVIHETHDPKVRMTPFHQFTLASGVKIPAYLYSSEYWGNRLVVIIPDAKITSTFEFQSADKRKETITEALPAIQGILSTYSVVSKK